MLSTSVENRYEQINTPFFVVNDGEKVRWKLLTFGNKKSLHFLSSSLYQTRIRFVKSFFRESFIFSSQPIERFLTVYYKLSIVDKLLMDMHLRPIVKKVIITVRPN